MTRSTAIGSIISAFAVAFTASGCGGGASSAATTAAPATACPAAYATQWKAFARASAMTVFCPSYLPSPLDADLKGRMAAVDEPGTRHWQIGFVDVDPGGFASLSHVVLEGYARGAFPPHCHDTRKRGSRIVPVAVPCFAGRFGTSQVHGKRVVWYDHNSATHRGHVAGVFSSGGRTYVVSMHVEQPRGRAGTRAQVQQIIAGLVPVAS